MKKELLLAVGIILILVGMLVPLTTIPVVFILPESFASTARVAPAVTESSAIATEMEKIKSKSVLYTVVTNLDLNRKWASRYKEEGSLRTDVTFLILKTQIDVCQYRNTTIIEIKVFSEDRDEAAAIANSIAEVYQISSLAAKGPNAGSAVQIIDRAEPGMRPVRPNKPLTIGIVCGVGAILAAVGVILIFISKKRAASTHL